jgi:ammonia channel protein AmtB
MTLTLDRPPRIDPEARLAIDEPEPDWLVRGRPLEDRSFEAVETTAGAVVGLTVGMAVAGPVGALIGGVVGGAVAFEAGEALERSIGTAARTTDATDEHTPPVD